MPNKLREQGESCRVDMRAGESLLSYINGVQHLGSVVKSIVMDVASNEMDLVIRNRPQPQFTNTTIALDALRVNKALFLLEIVRSHELEDKLR